PHHIPTRRSSDLDAGHEVANHTWSQPRLWACGPRLTHEEIARCHDTIGEQTGGAPRHFRPPWGMVNAAMWGALKQTGERCIFWSLQSEGLRARSAETQARYVLTRARPGAIVDLHDAEGVAGAPARLVAALPAKHLALDAHLSAGLADGRQRQSEPQPLVVSQDAGVAAGQTLRLRHEEPERPGGVIDPPALGIQRLLGGGPDAIEVGGIRR